jgi:hypothetical protein
MHLRQLLVLLLLLLSSACYLSFGCVCAPLSHTPTVLLANMSSIKFASREHQLDCREQLSPHAGFRYITLACFESRISEIGIVVQR